MNRSIGDTEMFPAKRKGFCINCGKVWQNHYDWSCVSLPSYTVRGLYSKTPPDQRYLTADMQVNVLAPTYNDTEVMPAERLGILCMNCNAPHTNHYGWKCNGWNDPKRSDISGNRSNCYPDQRYLTPDMIDDRQKINETPTLRSIKVAANDPSTEWKAWRDSSIQTGECVCGIQVSACRYHRPEGDNIQPRTGWSFFGAKQ